MIAPKSQGQTKASLTSIARKKVRQTESRKRMGNRNCQVHFELSDLLATGGTMEAYVSRRGKPTASGL